MAEVQGRRIEVAVFQRLGRGIENEVTFEKPAVEDGEGVLAQAAEDTVGEHDEGILHVLGEGDVGAVFQIPHGEIEQAVLGPFGECGMAFPGFDPIFHGVGEEIANVRRARLVERELVPGVKKTIAQASGAGGELYDVDGFFGTDRGGGVAEEGVNGFGIRASEEGMGREPAHAVPEVGALNFPQSRLGKAHGLLKAHEPTPVREAASDARLHRSGRRPPPPR